MKGDADPIARAVRDEDWELVALYALVRFLEAARRTPDATIDDLIAALAEPEDGGERERER
jgi:hypothetical protein